MVTLKVASILFSISMVYFEDIVCRERLFSNQKITLVTEKSIISGNQTLVTCTCPKCCIVCLSDIPECVPRSYVSQTTLVLGALRSGRIPTHLCFWHVVTLSPVLSN